MDREQIVREIEILWCTGGIKYFTIGGGYTLNECDEELFLPELRSIFPSMHKLEGLYYTWAGDWNDHMRPVISLYKLTGRAVFRWGWNYDFIPEPVRSMELQYYRTDKKAHPQLIGCTEAYATYRNFRCEEVVDRSLNPDFLKKWNRLSFQIIFPQIRDWYADVNDSESMIRKAEEMKYKKRMENCHIPDFSYVEAFLLMRTGREREAVEELRKSGTYTASTDVQKAKIEKKLREVGP